MRRGFSPAATAAFVTTLVVLGLVGWSIGWLAAGSDPVSTQSTQSPTAAATQVTKSPSPAQSRTPAPSATVSPRRTDAFAMPNLVGKKFLDARNEARNARLGVNVKFDAPGNGKPAGTVMSTEPEAKNLVYPGLTIILFVSGPATKVIVPEIGGKNCVDGKDELINVGLRIESYPSGERGKVVKTDPAAYTELKWNDGVKLYCAP